MKWLHTCCILGVLFSCNPYKFYTKKDFKFYQENFTQTNPFPKTNGVYVLEKVWTKRDGYINNYEYKNYHHFYKFFKTGQHNSYLIAKNDKPIDFLEIIKKGTENYKEGERTLFQGYFKTQENYIILENVNASLSSFYYTHGKMKNDTLTIISTKVQDSKEFKEKKILT